MMSSFRTTPRRLMKRHKPGCPTSDDRVWDSPAAYVHSVLQRLNHDGNTLTAPDAEGATPIFPPCRLSSTANDNNSLVPLAPTG